MLGHPARGIAWVARRLAPYGLAIEPGQIVLSDRTREFAASRFDFEELGEMRQTESLETVEVYALTHETMEHIESGRLAEV